MLFASCHLVTKPHASKPQQAHVELIHAMASIQADSLSIKKEDETGEKEANSQLEPGYRTGSLGTQRIEEVARMGIRAFRGEIEVADEEQNTSSRYESKQ